MTACGHRDDGFVTKTRVPTRTSVGNASIGAEGRSEKAAAEQVKLATARNSSDGGASGLTACFTNSRTISKRCRCSRTSWPGRGTLSAPERRRPCYVRWGSIGAARDQVRKEMPMPPLVLSSDSHVFEPPDLWQ